MKKKKKRAKEANQGTSTRKEGQSYLERLNSKYDGSKVGQVFIMPVKKRK